MTAIDVIKGSVRSLIGHNGGPSMGSGKGNIAYFRGPAAASFLGGMVRPALRETADDIRAAWQVATSSAIDRIQNSGFISGVVDASTAGVVGNGLILAARPEREALGWTETRAQEWGAMVEGRFRIWAGSPRDCDAGGRMTFNQMQLAAYKSYLFYGEILARLPMFRDRARAPLTKVQLLPPSRLQESAFDIMNRTKHGVVLDANGRATGYVFKMMDRNGFMVDRTMQAFDRDGRQQVIHIFDPMLMGVRGISPLAPVLKVCAQVEQLADATLSATLLQTMFAATIRNNTPGLQAFSGLMTEDEQGQAREKTLSIDGFVDARDDWYDSAKLNLHQHGRVAHLFPNDELEFHEAKHPSENYDNFAGWLLREVARCVGVTYEEATGDYRSATYSSVRMGTATMWPIALQRRQNIAGAFCQSVYEAWLEEEIGTGKIPFPGGLDGFLENKAAACGAWWNGPAAPQADDLKAARADEVLMSIGATTLESISAKYGRDWRDDMDQRKREKDYALKLGLPDPHQPPEQRAAEFKRSEQGADEDKTDNPNYAPEARKLESIGDRHAREDAEIDEGEAK